MATDSDLAMRLWLSAIFTEAGRTEHLYLDVQDPQRLLTTTGTVRPPPAVRGGVVVCDGESTDPQPSVGGTLRVSRALLWSWLDPTSAGGMTRLAAAESVMAQRRLRTEARHLWYRLRWWASLSQALRQECRRLVMAQGGEAGRLFAMLDWLATRIDNDPFAGWAADPAGKAVGATGPPATEDGEAERRRPPPPRPFPSTPPEIAAWMLTRDGLGQLYGDLYQPREEQAAMAEQVARALAEGRPLLVEAGTGIGKTLAYLLPLLQAVDAGGKRAVVSTHTRALQNQLLVKDLPLVLVLFPKTKVRLLMGRNNYLCRRRHLEFLGRVPESCTDACSKVAFRLWLADSEDGMKDELANHPLLRSYLTELFETAEPCSASVCYEDDACFVQRARRLAREANLLVVNHSLLMHDLAAEGFLIGPYDLLVVDEAHRLPQVALETHAVRCDPTRLRAIEELIGPVPPKGELPILLQHLSDQLAPPGAPDTVLAASLAEVAAAVASCFRAFHSWWEGVGAACTTRISDEDRPGFRVRIFDKDQTFGPLRPQTQRLLASAAAASSAYALVSERAERLPELPPGAEENLATLAQAGSMLAALERDIRFLTADEDENWVTWFQPGAKSGARTLGATRLESGELLHDYWLATDLRPIVTSATLAVGEDFTHMLTELGLTRWHPPTQTYLVASPFDYSRQALVLIPADFPGPDEDGFAAELTALLRRLRSEVPRKTMVLFTSYRLLHEVAGALLDDQASRRVMPLPSKRADNRAAAPDTPADLFSVGGEDVHDPLFPPGQPDQHRGNRDGAGEIASGAELIWQKRSGGTRDLLDRFRQVNQAMLLGTTTFWEGIDFPGSDLEVLVVTKLPFQVPNDPWVEARCGRIHAAGDDPFTTFMVRDAVLRLRQGFGRLIRRQSDRGVVVLLDTRLHTRSYGATFLSALPTTPHIYRDAQDLIAKMASFFAGTSS